VFAARRLTAPWALCPSTTEADDVREWLTWATSFETARFGVANHEFWGTP
jgi:hypothetical protein